MTNVISNNKEISLMVLALIVGLGVWVAIVPDPVFHYPPYCSSPEVLEMVTESGKYAHRVSGSPCSHAGGIHDRVMEFFSEKERFDP